jgi:hypothetical protein
VSRSARVPDRAKAVPVRRAKCRSPARFPPPELLRCRGVWTTRLGLTQQAFLGALFGGSDDQVLTGQMSEPAWWDIVADRLSAGSDLLAELRPPPYQRHRRHHPDRRLPLHTTTRDHEKILIHRS